MVGGLELGGFDVVMVDVCEVVHEMHKFSVVLGMQMILYIWLL